MEDTNKHNKEKLSLDLKELGLEELEINTDTMLEEMGASVGPTGCCSIVIILPTD